MKNKFDWVKVVYAKSIMLSGVGSIMMGILLLSSQKVTINQNVNAGYILLAVGCISFFGSFAKDLVQSLKPYLKIKKGKTLQERVLEASK